METPKSTILLLLPVICISTLVCSSSSSSLSADADFTINNYLWKSCNATLYRRKCYASLISNATYIGTDPIRLSIAAAEVAEARINFVSAKLDVIHNSILTVNSKANPQLASAMVDCVSMFSSAEYRMQISKSEIKALVSAEGMDIKYHISNAQTWLSAVLTDQDTCIEGLIYFAVDGDLSDGEKSIKAFVISRVKDTECFSSNVLSLVNSLAN